MFIYLSFLLVECPVCGEKVKVLLINAHLDRCLCEPFLSVSPPPTPPLQRVLPPSTQSLPPKLSGVPIIYKQGKALPRLPKFVFSIMKDRELKKKLKEYHLPTHGQRKALIARLEEFTLQYKAQQDSLCPKAGMWEGDREEGGRKRGGGGRETMREGVPVQYHLNFNSNSS